MRHRFLKTALTASLFFSVLPCLLAADRQAQPISDAQFQRLRQRVQEKLDSLKKDAAYPGVTVGFVLADGRSTSVSAGLADVEGNVPLRPSDRMLAGSIGKTFVAAVVLQLVEEGRVCLDDKLETWLGTEPWFARLPNGRDLTIRTLMTHSSGLPEYFELKGVNQALLANPNRDWTPAELIGFVLDAKPLFPVGKGWAYADTNYVLVGMVVEKVTGKPLFDEITRRLLRPFKLERTIPSNRRVLPELAVGYSMPRSPFGLREGRVVVDGQFVLNPQFEYAGGGLASTAEDLARWAKLLYEGKPFRKKETLEAMLTGVDAFSGRGGGKGQKYGLGVQIRTSQWGPSYGHGGWFPGYLSEMEYFPDYGIAIAVQFNTDAGRSIKKGPPAYVGDLMKLMLVAD